MKRNKPSIGSAQEHLPLAVLRHYQEGLLPAPQEHRVERHLLDCELCSDVLAGMAAQSARQTAVAVREINQTLAAGRQRKAGFLVPRFSQRHLAVAATILLLVCAASLVFLYNLEKVKQATEVPVAAHKPDTQAGQAKSPAPVSVGPPAAVVRPSGPSAPPVNPPADLLAANQEASAASGKAQESILASVTAGETEDIVVEVLPPETAAPETKPDSGWVKTGAIAAAPAKLLKRQAAGAAAETGRIAPVQKQDMSQTAGGQAPAGSTISGRVLDAAGQPLPGVTVLRKGTTQGTVTDQEGKYSLSLPKGLDAATLTYHFIGYASLEKEVNARDLAAVEVRLAADSLALGEVVVVGYGREGKSAADASPVGGWKRFKQHLQANLRHPDEAGGRKVSGRVVVGFTVNSDGSLGDIRVLKSLSPATDAEALRLVQQGPRWQPAAAGPQPIRITIRFRTAR